MANIIKGKSFSSSYRSRFQHTDGSPNYHIPYNLSHQFGSFFGRLPTSPCQENALSMRLPHDGASFGTSSPQETFSVLFCDSALSSIDESNSLASSQCSSAHASGCDEGIGVYFTPKTGSERFFEETLVSLGVHLMDPKKAFGKIPDISVDISNSDSASFYDNGLSSTCCTNNNIEAKLFHEIVEPQPSSASEENECNYKLDIQTIQQCETNLTNFCNGKKLNAKRKPTGKNDQNLHPSNSSNHSNVTNGQSVESPHKEDNASIQDDPLHCNDSVLDKAVHVTPFNAPKELRKRTNLTAPMEFTDFESLGSPSEDSFQLVTSRKAKKQQQQHRAGPGKSVLLPPPDNVKLMRRGRQSYHGVGDSVKSSPSCGLDQRRAGVNGQLQHSGVMERRSASNNTFVLPKSGRSRKEGHPEGPLASTDTSSVNSLSLSDKLTNGTNSNYSKISQSIHSSHEIHPSEKADISPAASHQRIQLFTKPSSRPLSEADKSLRWVCFNRWNSFKKELSQMASVAPEKIGYF